MKQIDKITMQSIGFEPDGKGGYRRVSKTPPQPGKAVQKALIDSGLIFEARREAQ